MALEYKTNSNIDSLLPVLDQHVVWYGKIIKGYFERKPFNEPFPEIFGSWIMQAKKNADIREKTADRLERLYQEMMDSAQIFIAKCNMSFEELPLKEYKEFTKYYEEFIQAIRRVERDQAIENSGFDEKTGLRSMRVMRSDIAVEMERVARQGNPFAIALVRVNNFNAEWNEMVNEDFAYAIAQGFGKKIKECLRAFDDAYYLGQSYFMLSLKHADMIGADAALSRLNKATKGMSIRLPSGEDFLLTTTAVVFEPSPADKLDDVLSNMKKDIESAGQTVAVFKYNDISPLQRYVQDMGKVKRNKDYDSSR
jgi:GGDEF domain-containing protein